MQAGGVRESLRASAPGAKSSMSVCAIVSAYFFVGPQVMLAIAAHQQHIVCDFLCFWQGWQWSQP